MFWYQCRYCKVNFDHWEKLVTHRRDEHRLEFEALKRRSALLLRKQDEALESRLEHRDNAEEIAVKVTSMPTTVLTTTTMKHTSTSATSTSVSSSNLIRPLRRNQHPISKEVDAKDLENQEITLCSPSSSNNSRSSSSFVPSNRSSTPPCSFLTPASSPQVNGSITYRMSRSENGYGGSNRVHTVTNSSYLTPPVTPSRVSSSVFSSLMPEEELELHVNWSPPVDVGTAVQYHQLSDDDEIEISVIPSAGTCIAVTKHLGHTSSSPAVATSTATRPSPPHYVNGDGIKSEGNCSNKDCQHGVLRRQHQQLSNSHVVIENLEDELQMTCSTTGNTNSACKTGERSVTFSRSPEAFVGARRRSHDEMMRRTGQRLKRLHSQLKQRQDHQIRTRLTFSAKMTHLVSTAVTENGRNKIASKILRGCINNTTTSESNDEIGSRILRRPSSRAISTNVPHLLRLSTRASTRRPK